MAKIDIMALFRSLKSAISEGINYAKNGYSRTNVSAEQKILGKNDDEPFELKQLTLNNIPKDIEEQITTNFMKIIDFIETFLMSDTTAGFYGSLMSEFELGINFKQKGLCDISLKEYTPKLLYNPFYCTDYTLNELLGATVTELEKILFLHPSLYKKLNPEKNPDLHDDLEAASNTSATELVYRDVKIESNNNRLKLHKDQYTISDLQSELDNPNRSLSRTESLDYYFTVAQAFRKKNKNKNNGNGNGQGNGDSVSVPMSGNGNGQNNNNNNGLSMPGNGNGDNIHDWESAGGSADEIEDKLKDMCKDALDSLSERQRGLAPAGIVKQIEAMFKKPEMNWKQYFRKFIGLIPANHRPSRMRLNRRQPDRFDLSGQLSDKVVRVVICIDTSGSMSDDILAYCLNEVYGMAKSYKTEYTIIECDAQVGRVYTITDPRQIKCELTGRGGTSYTPAIEYINEHKFKDAVMVYFTDGYGDYEIPRPKTYRNLWVITQGEASCLSLREPYGEVKSIATDPDYLAKFKKGGR